MGLGLMIDKSKSEIGEDRSDVAERKCGLKGGKRKKGGGGNGRELIRCDLEEDVLTGGWEGRNMTGACEKREIEVEGGWQGGFETITKGDEAGKAKKERPSQAALRARTRPRTRLRSVKQGGKNSRGSTGGRGVPQKRVGGVFVVGEEREAATVGATGRSSAQQGSRTENADRGRQKENEIKMGVFRWSGWSCCCSCVGGVPEPE
jgi:hypothetical protein